MIHRDFVLIETPPGVVMNSVRVITMMSVNERIQAISERPDLLFKVIDQTEKDKMLTPESQQTNPVMVTEEVENVENVKGISVDGMVIPYDLEKMLEDL